MSFTEPVTQARSAARGAPAPGVALGVGEVIGTHHEAALFSRTLTTSGTEAAPVATGYGTVSISSGLIRQAYSFFG